MWTGGARTGTTDLLIGDSPYRRYGLTSIRTWSDGKIIYTEFSLKDFQIFFILYYSLIKIITFRCQYHQTWVIMITGQNTGSWGPSSVFAHITALPRHVAVFAWLTRFSSAHQARDPTVRSRSPSAILSYNPTREWNSPFSQLCPYSSKSHPRQSCVSAGLQKRNRRGVLCGPITPLEESKRGIYYGFEQPAVEKKKRRGCRG